MFTPLVWPVMLQLDIRTKALGPDIRTPLTPLPLMKVESTLFTVTPAVAKPDEEFLNRTERFMSKLVLLTILIPFAHLSILTLSIVPEIVPAVVVELIPLPLQL